MQDMLRFNEIVFGPIRSRRLGSSLGINLLPLNGKLCNFDCIYCECGWNKDGRDDRRLPELKEVEAALVSKLEECKRDGTVIDSITFSGNGEPTLHPCFPEIVDIVVALRDRFYPTAKISVLSNATTLGRDKVFRALKKVDNPILKLDAVSDEDIVLINRPSGRYNVDEVIAGMKRFDGDFVLQTMFLKGGGTDTSETSKAERWLNVVWELKPREIMVYTLDREAPAKGLDKFTVEEMRAIVAPLIEDGFNVSISG